jgi:hypothetical protein
MGQNSTEVAYGFGQFGSTLLKGSGAKLNLTAATAKYYTCAITMLEDSTFTRLESLDDGIGMGMGNTAFVGTDVIAIDTAWNATDADTTNETDEDADAVISSDIFPKGVTIYGMWDNVVVNSGMMIAYVAPRPDYRNRA